MKYYTEDHFWLEVIDGEATIGITGYGVRELGDILSIRLPAEGDDYIVGDAFATVNGCTVYAPISGTVSSINEILDSEPALLNNSPEDKGWVCRFEDFDITELDDMLPVNAYDKYLKTL